MVKSDSLIAFAAAVVVAVNAADAAQLRAEGPNRLLAETSGSGSTDASASDSGIPQLVPDDSIDIARPVFSAAVASSDDSVADEGDDGDDFLLAVDPLETDCSRDDGSWDSPMWGDEVDGSDEGSERRRLMAEESGSGSYDAAMFSSDGFEASSEFDDTSALTTGIRLWGQCGGMYHEGGGTECSAGTYCKFMSTWISICYPEA